MKQTATKTIKTMCKLVGAKNDNQLSIALEVTSAVPGRWRAANAVPDIYMQKAIKIHNDMISAATALSEFSIDDEDIADALGVDSMRYRLILYGLKMRNAIGDNSPLDNIFVEDKEVAKAIGIDPRNIHAMKKTHPDRYKLLMDGYKVLRAKEIVDK